MISFIEGEIIEKNLTSIIINAGGIGYELLCSNFTLEKSKNVAELDRLYSYMHISDNDIKLIGFKTKEEKKLFLNLLEVSGVGAKSALAVLSGVSLSGLISAIICGDADLISKAKGISKKTAEKIIVELKTKIAKEYKVTKLSDSVSAEQRLSGIFEEAALALISLGLTSKEAAEYVSLVKTGNEKTVEEIVSKVLRRM